MIKLITFDLDDTLWPIEDVIKKASLASQFWLDEHYPIIGQQFSSQGLLNLSKELLKKHPNMSGDFTRIRKSTVYHAALHSGISDTEAHTLSEKAFQLFLKERNKVTLFPDAKYLLEKLNKNFNLIALSNGNADLGVIGIEHLFSEHYKAGAGIAAKPHAQMFNMALNSAAVQAHESVHVGDNFECDIQAAHQLGFKTIYTNLLNDDNSDSDALASASVKALKDIPEVIASFS